MCGSCCPKNPPKPFSIGCSCWYSSQSDVFGLMLVGHLMQRLARDLGLAQQFVKLIVLEDKHLNRPTYRSADRCPPFALVEECHFAEDFPRSELQGDDIRLIGAWQDHLDRALGHDVEGVGIGTLHQDHCSGFILLCPGYMRGL